MQATVHRYDADSGSGEVIADTGELHPFAATAFATTGLRHLRPGQRLTVELGEDGTIAEMRLGSIVPRRGQALSPYPSP